MKHAAKISLIIILFLIVIPLIAGFTIMTLWNNIITDVCAFSAIGLPEGIGLFILGQILSGGFILAVFFIGGGIHAAGHNRGEWHTHWHAMSDDERREFIERRRREHFGFRKQAQDTQDAAE